MTRSMGMVSSIGRAVTGTMVNTGTIRGMDMESCTGLTALSMMEIGSLGHSMDLESSNCQMERERKVSSKIMSSKGARVVIMSPNHLLKKMQN